MNRLAAKIPSFRSLRSGALLDTALWLSFSILVSIAVPPGTADAQVTDDVVDPIVEARQRVRAVIAREDVSGGGIFHYVIFRLPSEEEANDPEWGLERNVIARGNMGFEGISRIILAPDTDYRMYALYADSLMFGSTLFTTPRAGETFTIPAMGFFNLEDSDADGDELSDIREFVVGTDDLEPDSDGDEVNDAAEVQQGTDPLDGVIATTGIVGVAPMPGEAFDIIATNNVAIVAGRTAGVSIFNIEASRTPTRIGQVDTPGDAFLISSSGTYVAVADLDAGLTIIDISDPPAAYVTQTVNLNSYVTAVATYGTIAFAGCANGIIAAVDMVSGTELSRHKGLSGRIWNLAVRGDYLYALRVGSLSVFRIEDGSLEFVRSVSASGSLGAGQRPLRIFLAEELLYTTFTSGLNVFSLADPGNPTLVKKHSTAQQGWEQISLNGNGLAFVAVAQNSTNDGVHHVSLYSVGEDGQALDFLTEFETSGLASSVAIYNGRGLVADSSEGLKIVNYLAFDRFGNDPTIVIETNAVENVFEEGKLLDARAQARDDVQIRNVQFFVNDEIAGTDGNYPFSFRLRAPLIASGVSSFTLHAVASDTGGNIATSEKLTIELVPDSTPPRIKSTLPGNAAFVGNASAISAVTSEIIDAESLDTTTFIVTHAGDDSLIGTADDASLNGTLSFDESTNRINWVYPSDLPLGVYQVTISPPLSDLADNELEEPYIINFKILGFIDSDGDALPDYWELENGFQPDNPDSNSNGIPDGDEDGDNDKLPNVGEFLLDRNPADRDSDDDGIWDGNHDEDADGLLDGAEFQNGTDPLNNDSDGDGISDIDEILEGTNPLSPNSLPASLIASQSVSFLNALPHIPTTFEEQFTVASLPVSYLNALPGIPDDELLFSAASAPASYLNALPLPIDSDTVLAISPEVSYEATE